MTDTNQKPFTKNFNVQLIIIVLLIIFVITASFFTGRLLSNGSSNKTLVKQQTEIKRLEEALQEAKNNLLVSENTNHINLKSIENARKTIVLLEDQIYQQQKDIMSYRAVLSKRKSDSPLIFRDFIVHATQTQKVFRYKLILTRTDNTKNLIKGHLDIYITGTSHKKTQTIALSKLTVTEGHEKSIPFSFKYLEMIPPKDQFAELILPDDFKPKSIKIIAYLANSKKPIIQYFDWLPIALPTQEPAMISN